MSLRSYPNQGLAATETITELRTQAALAVEHGFDGVMTSEHHGGFAGYLPNPLQLAGFLLDAMPRGWAAPCPLLLPLRPAALVAEETAWLAARFPGRVGLGVAAGALAVDFEIMEVPMDDLAARFTNGLEEVARRVARRSGRTARGRSRDHPLSRSPRPLVERGRECHCGAPGRAGWRGFVVRLARHSGAGPRAGRRVSRRGRDGSLRARPALPGSAIHRAPKSNSRSTVYRDYAPSAAPTHWGADEMVVAADAATVAADYSTRRRLREPMR